MKLTIPKFKSVLEVAIASVTAGGMIIAAIWIFLSPKVDAKVDAKIDAYRQEREADRNQIVKAQGEFNQQMKSDITIIRRDVDDLQEGMKFIKVYARYADSLAYRRATTEQRNWRNPPRDP